VPWGTGWCVRVWLEPFEAAHWTWVTRTLNSIYDALSRGHILSTKVEAKER